MDTPHTYPIFQQAGIEYILAEYKGPSILVRDKYDPKDVEVTAYLKDGSQITIPNEYYVYNDEFIIHDNGPIKKFVYVYCYYTETIDDTVYVIYQMFEAEFFVPAIPRPIYLTAKHCGFFKLLDEQVYKHEVKVTITWLLNDFKIDELQTEDVVLKEDQWMFLSGDTVNNQNHGILFVNWRAMINRDYFNFTCPVHVITIDPSTVSLEAWYEGPEIEVGSYYDLRHVVVYLICPGLDKIRLHFFGEGIIIGDNEVQIEDGTDSINTHLSADRNQLLILKEGNNERTVQYKYKSISLEAVYYVPGVIYKIYPDVSLKVFYITEDTREEIDMTNDFLSYFTYSGEFFISWNSFILVLKDFIEEEKLDKPTHGLFRLEAPRRTGLFNKYASSWYVEVDKNLNVIAKIRKVYSDEIIIL